MRLNPLVLLLFLGCRASDPKGEKTAPVVTLLSPSEGAEVPGGAPVTFVAQVEDDADPLADLVFTWSIDGDGYLAGTQTVDEATVSFVTTAGFDPGAHEVRLTALDGEGAEGTDTVAFTAFENAAPTATFLEPAEGGRHLAGTPVEVDLEVADADTSDLSQLALTWSGTAAPADAPAAPGADGHARLFLDLEVGAWGLAVEVADPWGSRVTALVSFEVDDGDADDDGYVDEAYGGDDCDDSDGAVHPGAEEVCDGDDDDCDGVPDDGLDSDGDTVPDCFDEERCDRVDNDGDGEVDEADAVDAPLWYTDADADGYGLDGTGVPACTAPDGTAALAGDCDDDDPAYNPGALEDDCSDPADYNCDGSVSYTDDDGDGWAACEECDDGDAAVNPEAAEACNDVDDDCDGEVDEAGATGAGTWYADADGDGWGDPAVPVTACEAPTGYTADATDCDDGDRAIHPGASEACDAADTDEDCDGLADDDDTSPTGTSTWYADADGDGWGGSGPSVAGCDAPSGYVSSATDCDDADAAEHPGAGEVCDGDDDDCDGSADEGVTTTWYRDADGDRYGAASSSTPACSAPSGYVADATDCDDGDAAEHPGASEVCDGDDDDCDGSADESDATDASTWYADSDGDTYGDASVTTPACSRPSGYVGNDDDCDDGDAGVNPAATETCDSEDDDCDGSVDEGVRPTWYRDADGDGYGTPATTSTACSLPSGYSANDDDCDDTDSNVSPAGTERCDAADGDEDCDGLADDEDPSVASGGFSTWYADGDGDGYGGADSTTAACDQPAGHEAAADDCDDSSAATSPGAADRCNDGIDQDCDGADASCTYAWSGDYPIDSVLTYITKVYGETNSDYVGFGDSMTTGDFDGDGQAELVIGAWGDDTSASSAGAAFVQVGPLAAGAYDFNTYTTAEFYGGGHLGGHMETLADWDGDGDDELIVGRTSSYITQYVYEGGFAGSYTPSTGATVSTSVCKNILDFTSAGTFTSTATGQEWACGFESSYLYYIRVMAAGSDTAIALLYGESTSDYNGDALDGGPGKDANGDGLPELWIGASGDDDGGSQAGAVYIVEGGTVSGTYYLSALDGKIVGDTTSDYFGDTVVADDMDGDGYTDTVVGAYGNDDGGTDDGAAYLFFDTLDPAENDASDADALVYGSSGESVPYRIASGDINGDGEVDLLLCEPDSNDGGTSSQGAAWLFYGPVTGTLDIDAGDYDARFTGDDSSDEVGSTCTMRDDLTGDGLPDIAIGGEASGHGSLSNPGAIFVLAGG